MNGKSCVAHCWLIRSVKDSVALRFAPLLLGLQKNHGGIRASAAQLVPEPVALRAQCFKLVAMIQLSMNIKFVGHVFASFHMCVVCLSLVLPCSPGRV